VPTKPSQPTFQLRIELVDIEPAIWRRILVPASARLSKLHEMFQATMGWTNSHLHSFEVGDERYGMHLDDDWDDDPDEIDETTVTVLQVLRGHERFRYVYDFGDNWCHDGVIEDEIGSPFGLKFAVCVDGQNACPPEDCGGAGGFAELLEALADPSHEEHEEYLGWIGGSYDSSAFDLVAVNAALQRVR
jgi:Plasmid pRiA4b ORF-3-like protein